MPDFLFIETLAIRLLSLVVRSKFQSSRWNAGVHRWRRNWRAQRAAKRVTACLSNFSSHTVVEVQLNNFLNFPFAVGRRCRQLQSNLSQWIEHVERSETETSNNPTAGTFGTELDEIKLLYSIQLSKFGFAAYYYYPGHPNDLFPPGFGLDTSNARVPNGSTIRYIRCLLGGRFRTLYSQKYYSNFHSKYSRMILVFLRCAINWVALPRSSVVDLVVWWGSHVPCYKSAVATFPLVGLSPRSSLRESHEGRQRCARNITLKMKFRTISLGIREPRFDMRRECCDIRLC